MPGATDRMRHLLDRLLPSARETHESGESLEALLQANGFDPVQHERIQSELRAGQIGRFEKVAVTRVAPSYKSTGTIDTWRNLYVRTSNLDGFPYAFGVWQLAKSSAANPNSNPDVGVELMQEDGTAFPGDVDFGIDFDYQTGKIVMWDGYDNGTVWETEASLDAAGNVEPVWLVKKRPSTTLSQPVGAFVSGVLGKWHYISELGAYLALDEYNASTGELTLTGSGGGASGSRHPKTNPSHVSVRTVKSPSSALSTPP